MFRCAIFALVFGCPALVAANADGCDAVPPTPAKADQVLFQRQPPVQRSQLQSSQASAEAQAVSWAAAAAEFVAMTLFVIIGCGSAMGVAKEAGWVLQVSLSFGLAITSLAYAVGKYSGGQINCAVTFGLVISGNLGIVQGLVNFVAQMLGSVAGAFILSQMHPAKADKTGSIACNSISEAHSTVNALVGEIMMTALLMFVVLETATGAAATAPAGPLAPIAIGLAVFLAHSVLIPIDGCSINPTRSFGPAVVASLTREGKREEVWKDMPVFWAGPLAGAALAAVVHRGLATLVA